MLSLREDRPREELSLLVWLFKAHVQALHLPSCRFPFPWHAMLNFATLSAVLSTVT